MLNTTQIHPCSALHLKKFTARFLILALWRSGLDKKVEERLHGHR
jgi:hypothetical protein